MVLFTHRSGEHIGDPAQEQLKLLGLYVVGLIGGAVSLFVLRTFCLKLIARNTPEAVSMFVTLVMTMVWVGLLQALAMWALRQPVAQGRTALRRLGLCLLADIALPRQVAGRFTAPDAGRSGHCLCHFVCFWGDCHA
jgi:hypothetical protein